MTAIPRSTCSGLAAATSNCGALMLTVTTGGSACPSWAEEGEAGAPGSLEPGASLGLLSSGESGMCSLGGALGTLLVSVVVAVIVLVTLGPVPDPVGGDETTAHADEEPDEPFRNRADTAETDPAGVGGMLDLAGHVLDDVVELRRSDGPRTERRHVLRAGSDGLPHDARRQAVKGRGVVAVVEGVARSGDRVTRRAVQGEEAEARREAALLQVQLRGDRHSAGVERGDPHRDRPDLGGVEARLLVLRLGRRGLEGHPASGQPQVDYAGAEPLEVRPDPGVAVRRHAMAIRAVGLEQRVAVLELARARGGRALAGHHLEPGESGCLRR